MARSRRTPAVLTLSVLLGAFRQPKPDNRICCDTHLIVTGNFFMHCVKRACMAAENLDVSAGHGAGPVRARG